MAYGMEPDAVPEGASPATPAKHRRLRRVLIIFACICAVLVAVFIAYTGDYHHADAAALAACESDSQVAVVETSDTITFGDPTTAKAGFVFYQGAKVQAESYAPLMKAVARQGFFCVLCKMPFNLAMFDIDAADGAISAYPRITRWFVGGHSLGGAMASMWASSHADRICGIVFLGSYPAADLSSTGLRGLSVYGSEDKVLNRANYEKAAAARPPTWTELVIEGGNHAGFGDYGAQEGDGASTMTSAEQQALAAQAICDFMG